MAWFIGIFYKSLYTDALLNEVTTFAAFTALLVFLLGVGGVTVGRWLVDHNAPPMPRQRHHGLAATDERADTDVFAAVTDDMIDAMAVAGTAAEVREGLRRYEGVLDHIVLYSPSIGLAPERIAENLGSLIRDCAPAFAGGKGDQSG